MFGRLGLISVCALLLSLLDSVSSQSTSSTACGQVLSSQPPLRAVDAYACLTSTPFKPDIATALLDYWKTTLRFQSTLAYLRNPPRSYQQPGIDLLRGLDLIRAQIDAGVFENQYAFETAVQTLIQATHDGNILLAGSVLGVFEFGFPHGLVAISEDGSSVPKIYLADDLLANPDTSSPLTKINDEVAEDFLSVFASEHSFGFVEPHGDWNGLMYSGVASIMGVFGTITETIFYPGDEVKVEFANGTTIGPTPWVAYNMQGNGLSDLQTGEQFYNYFVLGNLPAVDPTSTEDSNSATATNNNAITATDDPTSDNSNSDDSGSDDSDSDDSDSSSNNSSSDNSGSDDSNSEGSGSSAATGWGVPYPTPADIMQPNLGDGGFVTGYLLNDTKTGVLSIPSFQLTDEASISFSQTVAEFIRRSKIAGLEKIVIDVQQNGGGDLNLVVDTFAQFFPNIKPFSGMRSRSFNLADQIGNTFTKALINNVSAFDDDDTFIDDLSADPFAVVANELNADTNTPFSSWAEYFGPHPDRGDAFSSTFTANMTNRTEAALSDGIMLHSSENVSSQPPFDAKDIVVLTDAFCSSECDYFMELMHHEAGVRTAVIGGLPQHGPMQARGGPRGAFIYSSDDLDDDFAMACELNSTLCDLLPTRTGPALNQSRILFNFADQIRPKENTPLQFIYEAADCRIFWKRDTFNDYEKLWNHAADASFRDDTLCVPQSDEHSNTLQTDTEGPSPDQLTSWASTNPAYQAQDNASMSAMAGLAQGQYDAGLHLFEKRLFRKLRKSVETMRDALCKDDRDCGGIANGYTCIHGAVQCRGKLVKISTGQCKPTCLSTPCKGTNCGKALCQGRGGTPKYIETGTCPKAGTQPSHCEHQKTCYCDVLNSKNEEEFCKEIAHEAATVVTALAGDPIVTEHVKL